MTVKLLTEHNLEFLSLKGGRTGSSEYTLVKMPLFLKSHVMAPVLFSSVYGSKYQISKLLYLCQF